VAGNPISGAPDFVIGAAFNPNVRRMAPEVRRLEKKVGKGARFAMTQPVFDPELVPRVYAATAHLDIPVFLGVMPLTTYRNAAFLHHEVPGIRIPEAILHRMKQADEAGETGVGLSIARELVDVGLQHAPGFYIMPQMEKYGPAAELVRHIKQPAAAAAAR
jgi:homocysteine S-methyltransferase